MSWIICLEVTRRRGAIGRIILGGILLGAVLWQESTVQAEATVDAGCLRGKVLCGYQGWFRCEGDAAGQGWVHWSRDARQVTPESLTFEMWPDMSEYEADERYSVPGFAYPDGRPAELFSSDCAATVLRHFRWMQAHKIDGVWQQRFLVGLPGGPYSHSYSSHERVVRHVASACEQTGRVWAISYDLAALPVEKIFDVLTNDWKRLVDQKIVNHDRYVHQDGLPVIQIWGFYYQNAHNAMTPELANRLIDFFHSPGPYRAYLVGGGSWDWRQVPDPQWQAFVLRFDAYAPWNVGNYSLDASQQAHAATHYWAEDKRVCEEHGVLWMPVVYPGFSWDNLQRCPPGSTIIPRRGGLFLWEQFCELAQMKVDTVYVAMFDEVDEGTAIFKVTSSPPTQAHFVGYEGLASDWYLRLVAEGVRMTRGERPVRRELPIN